MISECIQDLYEKLLTIPALTQSTGLALGGRQPDPGMLRISLPGAWIVFVAAQNTQATTVATPSRTTLATAVYAVDLHVPYASQSDLTTNQLPLVESAQAAIQGTDAPSGTRWLWVSTKLAGVNVDRMIYRLTFQVQQVVSA